MSSRDEDYGYIIEYVQVGRFMKVSAIDPLTGVEVCIAGDPNTDDSVLANAAVRKLKRKLSKP